jgi:hypothetical protein
MDKTRKAIGFVPASKLQTLPYWYTATSIADVRKPMVETKYKQQASI